MSSSVVTLEPPTRGRPEAAVEVPEEAEARDQEHRIFTGINVGAQTVTPATEHLPDEQKGLVRWLHWYAREKNWAWDDLVKAVGYSSTTWSRIFRDAYRFAKGEARSGERMPIEEHCKAIARFKKLVQEREAVRETGFIETSVWERVEWLCRRAFVRKKIGFIWGESQIGKSTCAIEFARRNNHGQTTYCEMPPSAGVQLMLRTVAEALAVPSRTSFDALLKDVIQALDDSKLLVIDEIQRVFTTYQKGSVMRCLDTLRYIHDQTRCGLVLVGTQVMKEQLTRGEFAQYLKQLKRRGRTLMLQLPTEPPRADLDLMSDAFGLGAATGEAEATLVQVAKSDGFGAVKMLLQDASERAAKKRRDVTWDDFVWAHGIAERMAATES
jgi:DNA transposition AAA+ family ATPase